MLFQVHGYKWIHVLLCCDAQHFIICGTFCYWILLTEMLHYSLHIFKNSIYTDFSSKD